MNFAHSSRLKRCEYCKIVGLMNVIVNFSMPHSFLLVRHNGFGSVALLSHFAKCKDRKCENEKCEKISMAQNA